MSDIIHILMTMASKKFNVPIENLKPESDMFDTLGINSIQALSLLTDLEQTFKIEIPDYEISDVRTFENLATVIESRV